MFIKAMMGLHNAGGVYSAKKEGIREGQPYLNMGKTNEYNYKENIENVAEDKSWHGDLSVVIPCHILKQGIGSSKYKKKKSVRMGGHNLYQEVRLPTLQGEVRHNSKHH